MGRTADDSEARFDLEANGQSQPNQVLQHQQALLSSPQAAVDVTHVEPQGESSVNVGDNEGGCPPWWLNLGRTTWYQYQCQETGETKILSSGSLLAASLESIHTWELCRSLVGPCEAVRCPSCGAMRPVIDPASGTACALPIWCSACDTEVLSWLPVTNRRYLCVTWFHLLCVCCGQINLVGNNACPSRCLHCHSASTPLRPMASAFPIHRLFAPPPPSAVSATASPRFSLAPLIAATAGALAPSSPSLPLVWAPTEAVHQMFPKRFRLLVKQMLMLAHRSDAEGTWMSKLPLELVELILQHVTPFSRKDPFANLWVRPCLAPKDTSQRRRSGRLSPIGVFKEPGRSVLAMFDDGRATPPPLFDVYRFACPTGPNFP